MSYIGENYDSWELADLMQKELGIIKNDYK